MSVLAVANAVKARWDATGLDVSIAALHPGNVGLTGMRGTAGGGGVGKRAVGGAAPGTELPRAEYVVGQDRVVSRSRGSKVLCQPVRFQVWGVEFETVAGHMDTIEQAFDNSESAASDPFAIPTSVGDVESVTHDDRTVVKQDDKLHQGVETIEVVYRVPNTIPS